MGSQVAIINTDMRFWFFKIYKHSAKTTASMTVPEKVFRYLIDKGFVEGTFEECRISTAGWNAVRKIFTNDELRGKNAKSQSKSKFPSTAELW